MSNLEQAKKLRAKIAKEAENNKPLVDELDDSSENTQNVNINKLNKDKLIELAKELEIELNGDETVKVLQELITAKQEE